MTELAVDDANLALRIAHGDKQAEAELFSRFKGAVHEIVRRITGSYALAEELTQEAVLITLRRLRTEPLGDPSKLHAFIAQTARNLALAERRKERRRRTDSGIDENDIPVEMAHDQRSPAEADSAANTVRALLRELPSERDRHILARHYLHDQDKADICRDLGITAPTFDVILFRARKRFLELLQARGISRSDLFCLVLA
jgi:RNA polymerase sigma-70 factor, ECF subfamily